MNAKQVPQHRQRRRRLTQDYTKPDVDEDYMNHHIVITEDWLRDLQVTTPTPERVAEEEGLRTSFRRQAKTTRKQRIPQVEDRGLETTHGFFDFPHKRLEKKLCYRFINVIDEGDLSSGSSKVPRPSKEDLERELPELVTGAVTLQKKMSKHKDLLYVKKPLTKHSRSLSFPQPKNMAAKYFGQRLGSGFRLPSRLGGDVIPFFPTSAHLPDNDKSADTDSFVRAWVQSGSATGDFLNRLDCVSPGIPGRGTKRDHSSRKSIQANVKKIDIKVPVDARHCGVLNRNRSTLM